MLSPWLLDDKQSQLNSWLIEKVKNDQWQVFLIAPIPVATKELYSKKKKWMEFMTAAGIHFVLPLIPSHNGMVYRYYVFPDSLASSIKASLNPDDDPNTQRCQDSEAKSNPKTNFGALLLKSGYQHRINEINKTSHKSTDCLQKWLNFNLHDDLTLIDTKSLQESAKNTEATQNTQTNSGNSWNVLLVGGDYGLTDVYTTPYSSSTISGAKLHALSILSQWSPVQRSSRYLELVIEIGLVTLLSMVLRRTYKLQTNPLSWRMPLLIALLHGLILLVYLYFSAALFTCFAFLTSPIILAPVVELSSSPIFFNKNKEKKVNKDKSPFRKFKPKIKIIVTLVVVISALILIAKE